MKCSFELYNTAINPQPEMIPKLAWSLFLGSRFQFLTFNFQRNDDSPWNELKTEDQDQEHQPCLKTDINQE